MKIIRYEPDRFSLEEHAISDQQRPPIISLPEYRQQHGITDWHPEETGLGLDENILHEESVV
jgi:hypothetical protein